MATITCSIVLCTVVALNLAINSSQYQPFTSGTISVICVSRSMQILHHKPRMFSNRGRRLLLVILLMSGDVEKTRNLVKMKLFGLVQCVTCLICHHQSCLFMCSHDARELEKSNSVCKCCKCDNLNCDSFTFKSFELQLSLNLYQHLTIQLIRFTRSPLYTSSLKSTNSYRNLSHALSRKKSSSKSYSKANPCEIPNLRIMNVNCRSIRDKTAEFKIETSYFKPDIICGTESWLYGIKPGKTSPDAIKSSMKDLDNLKKSLELLNGSESKELILSRDFNCHNIDWTTLTVNCGDVLDVLDRTIQ
ncbi:LOW QUALITY PROTEIN: hypothetical protein MAR_026517 [Mya arenaria]|uniref:Endonuclease/exonuclease/phosphatase domain-containing protein n=1 Tax=Mya arenaria TaxID=6604 RepID=A0ABY7EQS1_MYAAR|nr:LOW QUALITY PROTEIN: hypothetical protein MAR_026517 [Mya arenaria]